MNAQKEQLKYLTVRSAYMKMLLEREQNGVVDIPSFIKIKQIMDNITERGLLNQKYYQLKRWQLQGCLSNLFRLKVS